MHHVLCSAGLAALTVVGSTGCGGGCPTSDSIASRDRWEADLSTKTRLPLDEHGPITIKRDVHNFVLSAEPQAVAEAFGEVLSDPKRRFGLIRVDRPAADVGKDFELGQRFQGRYDLGKAIGAELQGDLKKLFGEFLEHEHVQEWLCVIENQHASDYGEVTELERNPPPGGAYRMKYEYLTGSPIAGSSTFIVRPVTDDAMLAKYCAAAPPSAPPPADAEQAGESPAEPSPAPAPPECALSVLTQVFVYQEQSESFATFFSTGGLKLHNQVVYSQALQTVALIDGAEILETDVPAAYKP